MARWGDGSDRGRNYALIGAGTAASAGVAGAGHALERSASRKVADFDRRGAAAMDTRERLFRTQAVAGSEIRGRRKFLLDLENSPQMQAVQQAKTKARRLREMPLPTEKEPRARELRVRGAAVGRYSQAKTRAKPQALASLKIRQARGEASMRSYMAGLHLAENNKIINELDAARKPAVRLASIGRGVKRAGIAGAVGIPLAAAAAGSAKQIAGRVKRDWAAPPRTVDEHLDETVARRRALQSAHAKMIADAKAEGDRYRRM